MNIRSETGTSSCLLIHPAISLKYPRRTPGIRFDSARLSPSYSSRQQICTRRVADARVASRVDTAKSLQHAERERPEIESRVETEDCDSTRVRLGDCAVSAMLPANNVDVFLILWRVTRSLSE